MPSERTEPSSPTIHRTAGSHAFATLLTTVISGFIVAYYEEQLIVPLQGLRQWSLWLVTTFELPLTVDLVTNILVATILSACWGITFHFAHR
jgi:hypothetical protein